MAVHYLLEQLKALMGKGSYNNFNAFGDLLVLKKDNRQAGVCD